MKIKLAISLLLFLIFTLLLVSGSVLSRNTVLVKSVIIEAPEPVIWRHLINVESYDRWVDEAEFKDFKYDSARGLIQRESHYNLSAGKLSFIENVQIQDPIRCINITPSQPYSTSYIENMYSHLTMETLADGSFQVGWQAEYTVRSMMGRLFNLIILKPALESFITTSLSNLKNMIEE